MPPNGTGVPYAQSASMKYLYTEVGWFTIRLRKGSKLGCFRVQEDLL